MISRCTKAPMLPATKELSSSSQPHSMITNYHVSPGRDAVTLTFNNATFIFHAKWLHDAQCEHGSSKTAANAFCQNHNEIHIQELNIIDVGIKTTLEVVWDDANSSCFPAVWLRVLAPLVAKDPEQKTLRGTNIPESWLANTLVIPEIPYEQISSEHQSDEEFLETKTSILDTLLLDSASGIIKIVNLPAVDAYSESSQKNNLVTQILKRLFGSVFQHSMRGPDETFKIASHYHESAERAIELPNYDTSEILLPHSDHAHYDNPVRVQGLHAIQGTSENTFIHAFAVLATLRKEDEDLYNALCSAPMVLGRVAQFYNPPLFQTTVDTAVRMKPGSHEIKCIRWHPHLAGYLLSPFEDFDKARRAHCKFQEIMRRDSHMFKTILRPGDLYIWDNFRILHGREKVFDIPRLAVGQTVIEQVVSDEYRTVKMNWLKEFVGEHWLVQTPTGQLDGLIQLVKAELKREKSEVDGTDQSVPPYFGERAFRQDGPLPTA